MTCPFDKAEQIAKAVLYEGYMLYPYRPSSTKNQQRATFGTLYPEHDPNVLRGIEKCNNRAQCVVLGSASSGLNVRVRFLQMVSRELDRSPEMGEEQIRLQEEVIERTIDVEFGLAEVLQRPRIERFEFHPSVKVEKLRESDGLSVGRIRRTQLPISGRIRLSAKSTDHADAFRLTVELLNTTPYAPGSEMPTLLLSLLSAHTLLAVQKGEFISLLDPPDDFRSEASACKNIGLFPVLVGDVGSKDVLLASPIILYDYPQVAPESAGDFFDATEMDEMLTLRVMTLTNDEKAQMRGSDERVRELLERTEASAREQLRRTHGIIRSMNPADKDVA